MTYAPGASTVHFDEISKTKIFASIDKIRGMRSIIKESYISLKNRLGRIPRLIDFYDNGEIDPIIIIREYKTYYAFIESMEKGEYVFGINDQEKLILEYLSKTILSGVRPDELTILKLLLTNSEIAIPQLIDECKIQYGYEITISQINEGRADKKLD